MAIAILALNLAGDTLSAGLQDGWHTLIGLPIGGAMIWYLLRHRQNQRAIQRSARSI